MSCRLFDMIYVFYDLILNVGPYAFKLSYISFCFMLRISCKALILIHVSIFDPYSYRAIFRTYHMLYLSVFRLVLVTPRQIVYPCKKVGILCEEDAPHIY